MNGENDNANKHFIRMIPMNSSISPKETKFSTLLNNTAKANLSTISFNDKKTNLNSKEKNSNLKNAKSATENLNLSKHYLATNNSNTDTSTYLNTINTCSFTSPKLNNNNLIGKSGFISSNILNSISTRFFSKNNSKQKNLRNAYNNINIDDNLNENLICKTEASDKKGCEENNSPINSAYKKKTNTYLKMKSSTCRNSQNINNNHNNKRFLMQQKNTISHLINLTHENSTTIEDRNKLSKLARKGEEKENLLTNLIKKSLKKSLNLSKKKDNANANNNKGDACKNFIDKLANKRKNNLNRNSNVIEKINGKAIPSINNLIQENLMNNHNHNHNNKSPLKKENKNSFQVNNFSGNNRFTKDNPSLEMKVNIHKNFMSNNEIKFRSIEVSSNKNKISLNKNMNNKVKSESKSPCKRGSKHNTPYKLNNQGETNYENFNTIETCKDSITNYCFSSNKKNISNKGNSISNYINSTSTKKFNFKKSNDEKQKPILIFNSQLKDQNSSPFIKLPNNALKSSVFNDNINSKNKNLKAKIFNLPSDQKVNSNVSFLSNDYKELSDANGNNSVLNSKFIEKEENFFVDESKLTQKEECLITNRKVGLKDNNMKIKENPFTKANSHKVNLNPNSNSHFEFKDNMRNIFFENIKGSSVLDNNQINQEGKSTFNRTQQLGFYTNANLNNKFFVVNKRKEYDLNNENNQFDDSLISENNKVFSFRKLENKYATLEDLKKSVMQSDNTVAKRIDYYTDNSPVNEGFSKEENKSSLNNLNEIGSTPYLNKNTADFSDNNNNNNFTNKLKKEQESKQQINSGIIGLTERLQRLGQKYNNLIKEPETDSPDIGNNKPELNMKPVSSNVNNYDELFNILSNNIQEMNELIRSEDCTKNNFNNNQIPFTRISNNNLIIKENTIVYSATKKNLYEYNKNNNNENHPLKNSEPEPISNAVNFLDNKSSFVFSNDIRRNLNFQDSNLMSNINLDKNDNLLITSKNHHNRVFSNDRSRLFSDSLSLNYQDFSMNHLNNNPIDNPLDKTEADRFVNLINYGYSGNAINNNNLIPKDFETRNQITNESKFNTNNANGDLKEKKMQESINNLNDILNYDADSLIYADNNNNNNNKNINANKEFYANDQKIIFENELRDSREILINNLIDNHIKNKSSFVNFHSSDNFYNNYTKRKFIAEFNDREFCFDSSRSIRNEMNVDKGLYCKTEIDNNKNNFEKEDRANRKQMIIYDKKLDKNLSSNEKLDNVIVKGANSKLDITECQYGVEINTQNYTNTAEAHKHIIDGNMRKDLMNGMSGNYNSNNPKGSLSIANNDKNKNCVLF